MSDCSQLQLVYIRDQRPDPIRPRARVMHYQPLTTGGRNMTNKIFSFAAIALIASACGDAKYQMGSSSGTYTPLRHVAQQPDLLNQYSCGSGDQVRICHVPPGNPEAKHTLCIGRAAVSAHIGHHQAYNGEEDYLGFCGDFAPPPPEPIDDLTDGSTTGGVDGGVDGGSTGGVDGGVDGGTTGTPIDPPSSEN